jgi:regulation of enolase protein 1 (concanavalin A-like superfamily)
MMNLLENVFPNQLGSLTWTHEPAQWEPLPGGGLRVFAPPETDYFQDPRGLYTKDSAPFLWQPVSGDFVARLYVRPTFATTYDAGCLVARYDQTHWAKICYESTDLGTHAVVSVVTNGLSDDANGVDLQVADVWLQIARQGNVFGMHYALDGQEWRMVRTFALPVPDRLQVGLAAQSPTGPGTAIDFMQFTVERHSVENLRAGV